MQRKKKLTKLFNIIYVIIVILFVTDAFTAIEIKNEALKWFVYCCTLLFTPAILIWNYLVFRPKFIAIALPVIILVLIFIIGPITMIFNSSSWKTQTILYQHGHFNFMKVENQTKNNGALGFGKRTVKVTYLSNWFMIVDQVPENITAKVEWVRVNKQIDE